MIIKIKKTDATIPTRGSSAAAGYDLYSTESRLILPGATEIFDTGVAVAIPEGYFGGIYARSGLSIKSGIRPANCIGVIDSDYRNNILVALHNDSDALYTVNKGDRIAQLIVQRFEELEFEEVEELDDTERGLGGLGSTGV